MPEIPFLEVARENLERLLSGRRVDRVEVRQVYILKSVEPPLEAALGERVAEVRRRGKYLGDDLTGDLSFVIQLMKVGRLRSFEAVKKPGRDVSLVIGFDGGTALHLTEAGPKKRASVRLERTAALESREPLARLGWGRSRRRSRWTRCGPRSRPTARL